MACCFTTSCAQCGGGWCLIRSRAANAPENGERRPWVDPPGHDFFFVLETDDYEALVEGLRPIIPSGSATIQPVGDMGAMVAKRIAEES